MRHLFLPLRRILALGPGVLTAVAVAAPAQAVTPIVDCRATNPATGTQWVYFGYVNTGSPVTIAFGAQNQIVPGFGFQGQPTVFNTGSYPRVLRAVFNQNVFSAIAWDLNGQQAIATLASTPVCAAGATGPASDLTPNSAKVHGLVEPDGGVTSYSFDYGTTIAYGQVTPPAALPSAPSKLVNETLTGLDPATTYHYRLVATNGTTSTVGDDATFTTPAAATAPAVDLALAQTLAPTAVQTGDLVTGLLTVTNAGASEASSVRIVDALPTGASFDAAGSSATCMPSASGTSAICEVGTVAAGTSATVAVAFRPTAAGMVSNAALVSGDQPDPEPQNNHAATDLTVTAPRQPPNATENPTLADLVLKRSAKRRISSGKRAKITLRVSNRGPVPATRARLVERLPNGLKLVSARVANRKCSGKSTVRCSLGTVAVGKTVVIVIKVAPSRTGRFSDSASVAADQPDTRVADNFASGTLRVTRARPR